MTDEEIWTTICEMAAREAGISPEQAKAILADAGFDAHHGTGFVDAIEIVLVRLKLWSKLTEFKKGTERTCDAMGVCERCGARGKVYWSEPWEGDPSPELCDRCADWIAEGIAANNLNRLEKLLREAQAKEKRCKKIN
jgi:hypothetical protein